MKSNEHFKQCPCCFEGWQTIDAFIKDPSLVLNGYKADFEALEYGLFFFTHLKPSCRSTMAIAVKDFMALYKGPRYVQRKTGLPGCPGHCLDMDQLDRCGQACECAFVREIMQLFNKQESTTDEQDRCNGNTDCRR